MNEPHRNKLPDTRRSITCKRSICGFRVYITIGFHDDGTNSSDATAATPGEVFIKLAKHGTELSGMTDCLAILLSMSLQYGVPWEKIRDKFLGYRFGKEDDQNKSLIDGIVRCVDEQINARISLLEPVNMQTCPHCKTLLIGNVEHKCSDFSNVGH